MLDYVGIFGAFNKTKIKYLVVGGIAVNLYGIPRLTYDIDLLLDLKNPNVKKFCGLLKRWQFKPRVPVNIMDFADKRKRRDWIERKNMKAFTLVNPDWPVSEIDVILQSPVNYTEGVKRATRVKVGRISIPVVSINDLIAMKSATGRRQDLADIRHLERLVREERDSKNA